MCAASKADVCQVSIGKLEVVYTMEEKIVFV